MLAVMAGTILAAGIVAGSWRYSKTRATLLSELVITAERCAVAFNPDELSRLPGTRSDLGTPAYTEIKRRLIQLRGADPRVRFVYILRRLPHTGKTLVLADSEPATSKDVSQPGDDYATGPFLPGLQELMSTDSSVTDGPYEDEFGTWVTAFTPIGPRSMEHPRHVLGVDLPAGQWYSTLWTSAFGTAGYVWMLLLLPLASLVSTQQQLRQGEALRNLTEAMEQGHSPIMILDLGLRIEYANAKFCRLLGYSRRELIGREWHEFHGAQAPEILTELVTTIRAGRPWTGEWMMSRKDGTPLAVRSGVTPVKNRNGRIRSFVGVFEDMTEVRQTETVLREAKERAEAGDRAKGQFLATMSHEVRTPLNGIVGFASLLLDTRLTAEQQEYVETIRTSSETLIQLTGDILDYARIESGRLKLEPQPCDPRECIENALDLVAAAALQKNIELLHWVDDGVPAAIQADVNRLRQVLVNLVNNAVKFTPSGEVEVRARTVSLTDPGDGSPATCVLEFSVRDTGIGISPRHHARMFRPFSQADESTTRRYGGTGLGLAICKNIVELMEGSISFMSEPDQGSTFTFTVRAPVSAEAPVVLRASPLQGLTLAVAIPPGGLRQELVRLGTSLGANVIQTVPSELPTQPGCDLAIVDLTTAEATELAADPTSRLGLPAEKMIGLIPVTLVGELRGALRQHFRLVLSKPLHHEALISVLGTAAPSASPGAAASALIAPAHFGFRVLIVEDNPVNQRLIQKIVVHLGCSWTTAANGAEAIESLPEARPDVILMDLHMPEMDGLTATLRIRAGEAGEFARELWIIALTADARAEQRERTLKAGANDYLTKPVRKEELRAAFLRYLAARPPAVG